VGGPAATGRRSTSSTSSSRRRTATIDLGQPQRPHDPKFGPDGRLYVTTELTQTITVIDPKTNKVVDQIPTGQPESHMLLLARDGKRAFTSNVHAGTVSAIDLKAKKVTTVIPVAKIAQRLAFSTDEKWVFTADQDEPRVAVIDAVGNKVSRYVAVPGIVYGTGATPDGRYLVLTLIKDNKVARLDLKHLAGGPGARRAEGAAGGARPARRQGRLRLVRRERQGAEIDLVAWKVVASSTPGAPWTAWPGPSLQRRPAEAGGPLARTLDAARCAACSCRSSLERAASRSLPHGRRYRVELARAG
jgi:YVTN family beta-propeller protein